MTDEAPRVSGWILPSAWFAATPGGLQYITDIPLAEIIQPASDPNWIAEYLAYHGDGCPAYRDAFDFEAGHGAAA